LNSEKSRPRQKRINKPMMKREQEKEH